MTIEELKIEANKLGYNIVKKRPYIKLLPCVCGQKRPQNWFKFNGENRGEIYKCPNCGLEAPAAKTERKARENWNTLVSTTQN